MAKLNQIIAIEKGIKSQAYGEVTALNKLLQKPELFNGFSKTYQSKEDADEQLPAEERRVQFTTDAVLKAAQKHLGELMQITARKDWSNATATADVKVEGDATPVLTNVPVTYLLFLEKQLTDLRTFANNLPVLDGNERWEKDPNTGFFRSNTVQTHRTKKVARPIVLYHATPEHPAQTQMATEDIIAGYWSQTKYSGAMPKPEKETLVERIDKLLRAVKEARESANSVDEIPAPNIENAVFDYLLPNGGSR